MKIGLTEIMNETPKIIRRIRSVIIYTLAGSLPFASYLAGKLNLTLDEYTSVVGIAMLLVRGASSLFGVNDEEQQVLRQGADV